MLQVNLGVNVKRMSEMTKDWMMKASAVPTQLRSATQQLLAPQLLTAISTVTGGWRERESSVSERERVKGER
jgi:hypothetical protein